MSFSFLKEIFKYDCEYIYIITYQNYELPINKPIITLSVCPYKDFILTTRPEKFLEKKKSFLEVDYDDVEAEYLLEDQ